MGGARLIIWAVSLLMLCRGIRAWKEETKMYHVGGKVMCQDCTQGWNEWVHGSTPLKGCKVAVTCMDKRRRVVYHAIDETDEQGVFDVTVNRYINSKELEAKDCLVRLVSSPHPVCKVPTNFSGGRSGVKLRRPSHIYRDLVKYTLGPFYFTSPMCEEPDTSESDDD